MNRAYNHYFFHYSATPLLVVNTADVDFVRNEQYWGDKPAWQRMEMTLGERVLCTVPSGGYFFFEEKVPEVTR